MKSNLYIGVMSGTSIDSIDAVLMKINQKSWEFIGGKTTRFPENIRSNLKEISRTKQKIDLKTLIELNNKTGYLFANCINQLLLRENIEPLKIRAIGLHGQTIMHHTQTKFPGSLQIGDPSLVAKQTSIPVISNFRNNDIACGGEGAPFAPLFHSWLFSQKKVNKVLINIGGISNISFLSEDGSYSGYDLGPGNILIDSWALRNNKGPFDNLGLWAAKGTVNSKLLNDLKSDSYFRKKSPKSTGTDYFNLEWIENKIIKNRYKEIKAVDIQATLTEMVAEVIYESIMLYPNSSQIAICGGGIHNKYLMSRIENKLEKDIKSTINWGLESKWIEAAGFSYLSKRFINKEYSDLSSVTGSNQKVLLGNICYPPQ